MAAAMATAGVAQAQDSVCVSLEARLVQLDRGAAGGGDPGQYDGPIAQQRGEIDRATEEARRAGCIGGFLFFQPTPQAKCPQLMTTIDRMQANLQRLTEAQGQYAYDPFTAARERSDVLGQLAANQCGSQFANGDNGYQPAGGGFLSSLFGLSRMRSLDDEGDGYPSDGGMGTYETLCVRSCDGFYFPISFSTVPSQFSADEATCQSMCPDGQAELYTHRNPGEDASQMISLAGQPYASLPNAFRFQKEYDKTCTCHAASASNAAVGIENFTDFGDDGGLQPLTVAPIAPIVSVPLPRLRPAAGEDPETIADRAGGLIPQPVQPKQAQSASADTGDGVRVVGPAFYYGQ